MRGAFAAALGTEAALVTSDQVEVFVNQCRECPHLYGAALGAIKQLQGLWRTMVPDTGGVLVWPMKRKRWFIRINNTCLQTVVDGGSETIAAWFGANRKSKEKGVSGKLRSWWRCAHSRLCARSQAAAV